MLDIRELSTLFGSVVVFTKETVGLLSFWLVFIGVGIGIGFLFGRGKLGNIFIDIYIALAVSKAVVVAVPASGLPFLGAVVFLVSLAFLIGIDQHLFDLHISNSSYDIFWRVLVMGVLVTGMALSAFVSFLPETTISKVSLLPLSTYFGSPIAGVFWLSLPLFVLVFMNRRLK